MSRRGIPCLGFPSKTAAACALKRAGMTHRAIAQCIGSTVNAVPGLLAQGRIYRKPSRLSDYGILRPSQVEGRHL